MKTFAKLFVLASLALSSPVFAACRQMTDAEIKEEMDRGYLSFKKITVAIQPEQQVVSIDPRLEIGGVIATAKSTLFSVYHNFASCPGGGIIRFDSTHSPTALPNVYDSGTPGIGYRLTYMRRSGFNSLLPFSSNIPDGPASGNWARFGIGSYFKLELIRTGQLQTVNQVANLGEIALGTGNGDHVQIISVKTGPMTVKVLPHCSVAADKLNIDFGTFGPDAVSYTDGPTQPIDFTVQCIGPTPPVSITAALSGTPDPENPSLIKNEGAAHLGILVHDRITGTTLKPNDPNSTLVQNPASALQSPFQLAATVLRVGTATPPPGKIQATATITLTIN
ncbi:fimbrial protein [Burkholderia glumae]|uniref:Fimbrial protein n=1 Tax=Burkholderia glumae TaxID=337 RepID=A0AAQ0BSQ3_BURGL|nr:fimbrial protein [Burkholderia glumae]ACR30642.1 Fimbrial protein [Burkholderia glumae BGR1]AJY63210.1 fimbrial family protein [Burkholderia glumae LMG 2196 = ATCC 33617]KHJ64823.1 fimbrial protein [Burkholderia glumae]MCM2484069.1 fimbrial protein [Burkholderia glumae]MCM2494409.1 fimbrial protein [Burkholderia glumae]